MTVIDKIKGALHKDESVHSAAPKETGLSSNPPPSDLSTPEHPAFDSKLVTVVFVLGGPGAGKSSYLDFVGCLSLILSLTGKGTQCEHLVRDYGFKHLSGRA
jgi:UMP-CMP kinase